MTAYRARNDAFKKIGFRFLQICLQTKLRQPQKLGQSRHCRSGWSAMPQSFTYILRSIPGTSIPIRVFFTRTLLSWTTQPKACFFVMLFVERYGPICRGSGSATVVVVVQGSSCIWEWYEFYPSARIYCCFERSYQVDNKYLAIFLYTMPWVKMDVCVPDDIFRVPAKNGYIWSVRGQKHVYIIKSSKKGTP